MEHNLLVRISEKTLHNGEAPGGKAIMFSDFSAMPDDDTYCPSFTGMIFLVLFQPLHLRPVQTFAHLSPPSD